MAIMMWAFPWPRNIVLCTDIANVLRWVEHARSHSPASSRILKAVNRFCLQQGVGVFPVYGRSERNVISDGLTRWSQVELDDWAAQEGMAEVDALSRLWEGLALSYNPNAQ